MAASTRPSLIAHTTPFVVMPEAVSNAGYYPSALGYYLWLDWMINTFGPDGTITADGQ